MFARNFATLLFVAALAIETSNGFLPQQRTLSRAKQVYPQLFSTSEDQEKPTLDDAEADGTIEVNEKEENLLSKLNSFLDTPILDANNKQDEGPIAEALKGFVRDDAELASLTFSVAVVIFFGVLTRAAVYLINGY